MNRKLNLLGICLLKTVCVFCGADQKLSADFKSAAYSLGQNLAQNNFDLVTGGSNTGLMKEVNDGHAQFGSDTQRFGVMPEIFKEFDVHHPSVLLENFTWTDSVHTRLAEFYSKCDAIVVLPGGFGTLHELMDSLVHNQFGLMNKQIYLLNLDSFWDHTIAQFKVMVNHQALAQKHLDHLNVVTSISELLIRLCSTKSVSLQQGFADKYWE